MNCVVNDIFSIFLYHLSFCYQAPSYYRVQKRILPKGVSAICNQQQVQKKSQDSYTIAIQNSLSFLCVKENADRRETIGQHWKHLGKLLVNLKTTPKTLGQLQDNSRTTLGQLMDNSWTTLGQLQDNFRISLRNSRTTLGQLQDNSRTTLGQLLNNSKTTLEQLQNNSRATLGQL